MYVYHSNLTTFPSWKRAMDRGEIVRDRYTTWETEILIKLAESRQFRNNEASSSRVDLFQNKLHTSISIKRFPLPLFLSFFKKTNIKKTIKKIKLNTFYILTYIINNRKPKIIIIPSCNNSWYLKNK